MRLLKIAGLSAVAALLAVNANPAFARPAPHRPHKVCKVERFHGHARRVCHWVR